MATKAKAKSTRPKPPLPLTRRERSTLRETRQYGLSAFGDNGELVTSKSATKTLACMTDAQRTLFFDQLEGFCNLSEALRGCN